MTELFDNGDKVEYRQGEEWLKGTVHALKTHETPDGKITRIAYLIDTGNKIREDVGFNTKTGKEEIVRQPEQVEVEQDEIRAVQ